MRKIVANVQMRAENCKFRGNGKNINSLNLARNHGGKKGKNANGGQQQIVGIYTYNIDKCWQ